MMMTQAFGGTVFRALFFTVPIVIVLAIIYPIQLPPSILDGVLFVLSTFVAFLVLAEINFIIGLLAFSFKSIMGVMRAKYYIIQLCSGLLLPIPFFPEWVQLVLKLLPFQTITFIPLQFYLGNVHGSQLLVMILTQIFWIVSLGFLGKLLWHKAMVKLTLQGG